MLMTLAVQTQENKNDWFKDLIKALTGFYGKIIEKLPLKSLNPQLTFIITIDMIFLLPILICLYIKTNTSNLIACGLILLLIIQVIPFVIIEIIHLNYDYKKGKQNKT